MTNSQKLGLLISRDVFFTSKVTGTAGELGLTVDVASDVLDARERLAGCRCVLIDLGVPELPVADVIAALPANDRPRVIAFGAHVHTRRLEEARDAGCDEVLTRGKLSAELPQLLQQWLAE